AERDARTRDRRPLPRRRYPPLRGRRLANRTAPRLPGPHDARQGHRGSRGVGTRAASRRPPGTGPRRARPPGAGRLMTPGARYAPVRERCGIADYSAALVPALRDHVTLQTVALEPNRLDPWALAADARCLSAADVAHVQHTYSFFGVDQL